MKSVTGGHKGTVTENRHDPLLAYRLGGLLYMPADKEGIVRKIEERRYPCLTSIAFCLEDAIRDEALENAETRLRGTLSALLRLRQEGKEIPLVFVRVRSPRHLAHVHAFLGGAGQVLTGYILPKFDLSNAEDYAALIHSLGRADGGPLYYMPILESRMIADAGTRVPCLKGIRRLCDGMKDRILNIRVGGADLCSLYGLRREENQSIYEIGVIQHILTDIVNVFRPDYVVSGAVWEYFGPDPRAPWGEGLKREIALDRLNGFIGKTAIHPSQLPLICRGLQVSRRDWADAKRILEWKEPALGVAKGGVQDRMNEVKCHIQWARQTAALAQIYGVRDEGGPRCGIQEKGCFAAGKTAE